MRFPIRLLAFLLAHYLAALAISVSSRSDWVEVIVCSVPVGVFFAIIGFPYLALEVPWAVTLFVTLDRCTRPWMRLLVTIAAMFLFVWIGQAVAPPEGAFKGLRSHSPERCLPPRSPSLPSRPGGVPARAPRHRPSPRRMVRLRPRRPHFHRHTQPRASTRTCSPATSTSAASSRKFSTTQLPSWKR
jgi:hypothetical protein